MLHHDEITIVAIFTIVAMFTIAAIDHNIATSIVVGVAILLSIVAMFTIAAIDHNIATPTTIVAKNHSCCNPAHTLRNFSWYSELTAN